MYNYNGYQIEKLTRNTYRIRPNGGSWIDMWGHYPKTLKEAKTLIDNL